LENITRRINHLETAKVSREKAFVATASELLPIETMRELWRRVDAGDDAGFVGVTGVELRGQADA
jgi:hypothetical protein